jgi:hypothetical protein
MNDALDIDLDDSDLHEEIALVAELMVAAAESPGHLDQARVDLLLGVGRGRGTAGPRGR